MNESKLWYSIVLDMNTQQFIATDKNNPNHIADGVTIEQAVKKLTSKGQ